MTTALDARLSLVVGHGESAFHLEAELALDQGVLVLFGPSGVGKTLTLRALAGLLPVRQGHLRVQGTTLIDVSAGVFVPPHERRVGYVPQQASLFPFLDVAANVAFGLPRSRRRSVEVDRWLEELGLERLRSRRVDSLSGGESQRVALARALATKPRLLLLDEPFASIDEDGAAALRSLLRDVMQRHAVSAVLVTHDRDEALTLGDRLVRFERGRTLAAGTPRDVLGLRRPT